MKTSNPLSQRLLLYVALLVILMCPLLYIAGEFFPRSLGFLEPIICPAEMHFDLVRESVSDERGNATASYLICTDGQEQVDVTGKMVAILFGLGILGAGLLVTWALTGPTKKPERPELKPE